MKVKFISLIYVFLFCLQVKAADPSLLTDTPLNSTDLNMLQTAELADIINLLSEAHPDFINNSLDDCSDAPTRFKLSSSKVDKTFLVDLDDNKDWLDASINYSFVPATNLINFGGDISLLNRILLNGSGSVQFSQGFSVNHDQRLIIYRFNFKSLTIEPVLVQNAALYIPLSSGDRLLNAVDIYMQPLSAGIDIKKNLNNKNHIKFGISGGSIINYRIANSQDSLSVLGVVNLRFGLTL